MSSFLCLWPLRNQQTRQTGDATVFRARKAIRVSCETTIVQACAKPYTPLSDFYLFVHFFFFCSFASELRTCVCVACANKMHRVISAHMCECACCRSSIRYVCYMSCLLVCLNTSNYLTLSFFDAFALTYHHYQSPHKVMCIVLYWTGPWIAKNILLVLDSFCAKFRNKLSGKASFIHPLTRTLGGCFLEFSSQEYFKQNWGYGR